MSDKLERDDQGRPTIGEVTIYEYQARPVVQVVYGGHVAWLDNTVSEMLGAAGYVRLDPFWTWAELVEPLDILPDDVEGMDGPLLGMRGWVRDKRLAELMHNICISDWPADPRYGGAMPMQ